MGVESFGVTMHMRSRRVADQLRVMLGKDYKIKFLHPNPQGQYEIWTGEYEDRLHYIECMLSTELKTSETTLSLRFSLCSHESIDSIFVNMVDHILESFEADVWLMTSALKADNHYTMLETTSFIGKLPDEIDAMRDYWQKIFGKRQGKVRVKDSFGFIGVE